MDKLKLIEEGVDIKEKERTAHADMLDILQTIRSNFN